MDRQTIIFRMNADDKKALQIKAIQEGTSIQEIMERLALNYIKGSNSILDKIPSRK